MTVIGQNLGRLLIIASLTLAGGCVSSKVKSDRPTSKIEPQPNAVEYEAVAASALVFDPPIAEYSAIGLSREGRERTAFIGYDSVISTYFYVRVDDRQRFFSADGIGRYERRAVSERFGVSHR